MSLPRRASGGSYRAGRLLGRWSRFGLRLGGARALEVPTCRQGIDHGADEPESAAAPGALQDIDLEHSFQKGRPEQVAT